MFGELRRGELVLESLDHVLELREHGGREKEDEVIVVVVLFVCVRALRA